VIQSIGKLLGRFSPSYGAFLNAIVLNLVIIIELAGVPATFQGGPEVQVLDHSVEKQLQKIPLGPVAPMVAIKQLGSNGGGWYGPNSSVPLENPTIFKLSGNAGNSPHSSLIDFYGGIFHST
jgi:K+-transporting ATPase A subunit